MNLVMKLPFYFTILERHPWPVRAKCYFR
uniref:Uncharacterized protein n=1 Tax=Anguilla anguilla TaxID=7936 RepID=A0A0E9QM83_ANGAN